MSTHPLPHIAQGQTSWRGRESKSSEEVSSTLKVDVVTSPQQYHPSAECWISTHSLSPANLLLSSTASDWGEGDVANTASHKRVRSTQGEGNCKHLTYNPYSQDRLWFADVRFKNRERGRAGLSIDVLSFAGRPDLSSTIPEGDAHQTEPAAALLHPCTSCKWWREAEHSSYHGISDSSPPSLPLMNWESDVYILSLKV